MFTYKIIFYCNLKGLSGLRGIKGKKFTELFKLFVNILIFLGLKGLPSDSHLINVNPEIRLQLNQLKEEFAELKQKIAFKNNLK